MGGRSRTASTTTSSQTVETTNVGLQDTSGIGIAGGGDVDVELNQTVTDLGAIQGAFDFSEGAFDFAGDVARRAAETSERAIETSQAALATSVTGGQSDLSKIDSRTIGFGIAALVIVLVVPRVFGRR